MALIVEDGSVVTGANGYITQAFLDAYWLNRNVTLSQTSDEKDAAIIISTQYVDLNNTWKGFIVDVDQSLDFPRQCIIDKEGRLLAEDAIPLQLQSAVAEYAKRQLDSAIQPDVEDTGAIKSLMTKLDVLEKKTEYQDGTGGYYGIKQYPLADNYLIGLTTGGIFGNFGKVGC
jgi:hypothetical protein